MNKKQQAELQLEMKRSTFTAGDEKRKSVTHAKDILEIKAIQSAYSRNAALDLTNQSSYGGNQKTINLNELKQSMNQSNPDLAQHQQQSRQQPQLIEVTEIFEPF